MTFKVLVYCHNYDINTRGHFMLDFIGKKINDYNVSDLPLKIETLDISPGGTYTCDGFAHHSDCRFPHKFDLVFLPDCGGNWYKYQIANYWDGLIEIIENVKGLINPGGHLIFSKVINPEFAKIVKRKYKPLIEKESIYSTTHYIVSVD